MPVKAYLLSCSLAFVGASQLQAASIFVSNLNYNPTDIAVVNSSGTAISNGFAAIFQYNGSVPANAGLMQANGNTGILESVALEPGNYPAGGAIFLSFGSITNDGVTSGLGPIFLVFGNGTDAASSTELGMLSLGITPDGIDTPTPDDYGTYTIDQGDIVVGSGGNGTYDWTAAGGDAVRNLSNFQLQSVPEATTSILALLGASLLLRRRR